MNQSISTKQKNVHYINGKEIYAEMCEYRKKYLLTVEQGLDRPEITDKMANAIIQIATRMATAHNFSGYTFRQDMISDGILKCVEKIHKFDPTRTDNFFAYASQILWNSFILRIKKENHQSSVKAKLIREKMSNEFVEHGVDFDSEDSGNSFIEFLKSNDAFTDYYQEAIIRDEKEKLSPTISTTLKHRNRTPYTKKAVVEKVIVHEVTMSDFEVA